MSAALAGRKRAALSVAATSATAALAAFSDAFSASAVAIALALEEFPRVSAEGYLLPSPA